MRFLQAKVDLKTSEGNYQVWHKGFYPKKLVGDDMMLQKLEYMHMNPVKRGYVDELEDWRYSSARNYLGDEEELLSITEY